MRVINCLFVQSVLVFYSYSFATNVSNEQSQIDIEWNKKFLLNLGFKVDSTKQTVLLREIDDQGITGSKTPFKLSEIYIPKSGTYILNLKTQKPLAVISNKETTKDNRNATIDPYSNRINNVEIIKFPFKTQLPNENIPFNDLPYEERKACLERLGVYIDAYGLIVTKEGKTKSASPAKIIFNKDGFFTYPWNDQQEHIYFLNPFKKEEPLPPLKTMAKSELISKKEYLKGPSKKTTLFLNKIKQEQYDAYQENRPSTTTNKKEKWWTIFKKPFSIFKGSKKIKSQSSAQVTKNDPSEKKDWRDQYYEKTIYDPNYSSDPEHSIFANGDK